MANEPIKIQVSGKDIRGESLNNLFVQGDKYAQVIEFTMNQYVDGVDIYTGVNYQINGLNSRNQSAVNVLAKSSSLVNGQFTLTWNVSDKFTVRDGKLVIWINAVKSHTDPSTGKDVVDLNWQTSPKEVFVRQGFLIGDYVSVTEQLLLDIAGMLGRAEQAATNSEGSAVRSAASATASANSASASQGSAIASANSAAAALASERNAQAYSNDARESALAAKESEVNSLQSEQAARSSEISAMQSAASATLSAADAKTSERIAVEHAMLSVESATSANDSANRAGEAAQLYTKLVLDTYAFLRDPTTGRMATIQTVVNNLFALHSFPITAGEFDSLNITAGEFDALMIAAYDFDSRGRQILIP